MFVFGPFLRIYWLRCVYCGKRRLRLGWGSAISTAYMHDDYCPAQIADRLHRALLRESRRG